MEFKAPAVINVPICNVKGQGECGTEGTRKKSFRGLLSRIACIQEGIELVLNTTDLADEKLRTDDFYEKKTVSLGCSASHVYQCSFEVFAPRVFTHLRYLFNVNNSEFHTSICSKPLIPLEQLGRSGSLFFLTFDNRYIVKTIQQKETEFLQKLLPWYILKLQENPDSILPRYYGLYSSKFKWHILRVIVMKNLFPSLSSIGQQYDLKGSTYGRTAIHGGRQTFTTMKDLDFMREYPSGLYLDGPVYDHIVSTIASDCNVLQNFNIMDYSLLIGIETVEGEGAMTAEESESTRESRTIEESESADSLTSAYGRFREDQPYWLNRRIEGRNVNGEKLYLYIGIIDILQNYNWARKAECFLKSVAYGKNAASVISPETYSMRFQTFVSSSVFRQLPEITSPSVNSYHTHTTQREFQSRKRKSLVHTEDQNIPVQEKPLANNISLKSVAKALT